MEYNVGDVLRADGELYKIIGKIQYKNIDDHCRWMEYRLKKVTDGDEFWLSIDDAMMSIPYHMRQSMCPWWL